MAKLPPPEIRFQKNLVALFELSRDLINDLNKRGHKYDGSGIIQAAEAFIQMNNPSEIITSFIEKTYTYWEKIEQKDLKHFTDNADKLFGGMTINFLGKEIVVDISAIKNLLIGTDGKGNYLVNQEDRDAIWVFLGSLVKISRSYDKEHKIIENYLRRKKLHIE